MYLDVFENPICSLSAPSGSITHIKSYIIIGLIAVFIKWQ